MAYLRGDRNLDERSLKPWYKSKTIWVNVLTVLAGMGSVVQLWTPILDPVIIGVGMSVVGLANIVLRTITTEGIRVPSTKA